MVFIYFFIIIFCKKKIFLFCKQIMRCDLLNCLCNIPTNTKSIYLFYWGNVKDSVEKTSYICTYTADDLAFKLRFALNCRVSKNTIRLCMYLVHLYNSALYVHRVTSFLLICQDTSHFLKGLNGNLKKSSIL